MGIVPAFFYSCVPWAITSFARMYVGAHYFSDCFFALIYGSIVTIATRMFYFYANWEHWWLEFYSMDRVTRMYFLNFLIV